MYKIVEKTADGYSAVEGKAFISLRTAFFKLCICKLEDAMILAQRELAIMNTLKKGQQIVTPAEYQHIVDELEGV